MSIQNNIIKKDNMRGKGYIVLLVIAGALLLLAIVLTQTAFTKRHTNLIIITVDTLRPDHLSCYGYHRETSPTIDKLAEEGALFKNCIAQRGLTCPSLTSIMTSQYPIQHGIRNNGYNYGEYDVTLALILKEKGYKTGVFSANKLNTPFLGFDTKKARKYRDFHLRDEYIVERARKWLRKNRNKTLFLWLHFMSVHAPYDPFSPYQEMFTDPNYQRRYVNGTRSVLNKITLQQIEFSEADLNYILGLYDGEIRFVDDLIKEVFETLADLHLIDKSLIVFTADHGEDLYARNHYFGHGHSIYDTSLRIPLIIRFAEKVTKTEIEHLVESIDIAPTILELLDIPVPEEFEGKSFLPLISSDATGTYDKTSAYSELEDKIYSIRTNKFRYIYNPTEFCADLFGDNERFYVIEKEELYDLRQDPSESDNIVEEDRQTAFRLSDQLSSWLGHYQKQEKFLKTPLSKEKIRELKALGYAR